MIESRHMLKLCEATERLYDTFAPYRIGTEPVACDYCVSPEKVARLTAKPLRDLTYDDLELYASKVMTTWGDERHFKHFLPRLMELAVDHRDDFLDLAVLFGKLRYAQWLSWPPGEVKAVDAFLREYWAYQLSLDIDSPFDVAIDTVLCSEASAFDSVQPLLAMWLADESHTANKHLAAFVLGNGDSLLRKQRLVNAFWESERPPHREVLCWLASPEVSAYLGNATLPDEFVPAKYQLELLRAVLPTGSA